MAEEIDWVPLPPKPKKTKAKILNDQKKVIMNAKYAGPCPHCPRKIEVGDIIYYFPNSKKTFCGACISNVRPLIDSSIRPVKKTFETEIDRQERIEISKQFKRDWT